MCGDRWTPVQASAVMPPNHPHYLHIKINCQDLRFMIPLGATWGAAAACLPWDAPAILSHNPATL